MSWGFEDYDDFEDFDEENPEFTHSSEMENHAGMCACMERYGDPQPKNWQLLFDNPGGAEYMNIYEPDPQQDAYYDAMAKQYFDEEVQALIDNPLLRFPDAVSQNAAADNPADDDDDPDLAELLGINDLEDPDDPDCDWEPEEYEDDFGRIHIIKARKEPVKSSDTAKKYPLYCMTPQGIVFCGYGNPPAGMIIPADAGLAAPKGNRHLNNQEDQYGFAPLDFYNDLMPITDEDDDEEDPAYQNNPFDFGIPDTDSEKHTEKPEAVRELSEEDKEFMREMGADPDLDMSDEFWFIHEYDPPEREEGDHSDWYGEESECEGGWFTESEDDTKPDILKDSANTQQILSRHTYEFCEVDDDKNPFLTEEDSDEAGNEEPAFDDKKQNDANAASAKDTGDIAPKADSEEESSDLAVNTPAFKACSPEPYKGGYLPQLPPELADIAKKHSGISENTADSACDKKEIHSDVLPDAETHNTSAAFSRAEIPENASENTAASDSGCENEGGFFCCDYDDGYTDEYGIPDEPCELDEMCDPCGFICFDHTDHKEASDKNDAPGTPAAACNAEAENSPAENPEEDDDGKKDSGGPKDPPDSGNADPFNISKELASFHESIVPQKQAEDKKTEENSKSRHKTFDKTDPLYSKDAAKKRHDYIKWACDLLHLQRNGASEKEIEKHKKKQPEYVYLFPGQRDTINFGRYYDDPINKEYFGDLFSEAAGGQNVLICSLSKPGKVESYYASYMFDSHFREKAFREFSNKDLCFTPDTYKVAGKDKKPSIAKKNLYAIKAIGIDIDYKKNDLYKNFTPAFMYDYIMDSMEGKIPAPNWIEYGNQLRFIYILQEPINCKNAKQGKNNGNGDIMALLDKERSVFCEMLNSTLDVHAEPQKSWYRVPGSVNSKTGDVVRVEHISDVKFTVQEICDEYLPDFQETSLEEKSVKKPNRKRNRVHAFFSAAALHKQRLDDYETLIRTWDKKIPRELFLELYIVSWIQWKGTENAESYMDELYRINKRLPDPLPEKEIKGKFGTMLTLMENKCYKYKNSTIMEQLDLTEEDCQIRGLHLHKDLKTQKKEERIAEGRTHEQMNRRRKAAIRPYIGTGLTSKQIAEKTGYCKRTIDYEIADVKAELEKAGENSLSVLKNKEAREAALKRAGEVLMDILCPKCEPLPERKKKVKSSGAPPALSPAAV